MLRNLMLQWIRRMGLMNRFDRIFFLYNRFRFRSRNAEFRKKHPEVSLPPDYMLYESYRLDYSDYFSDGKNTAQWVKEQISPYMNGQGNILEWGCGPARVVRHLPGVFPACKIYGSDYNPETIAWCRANIPGVEFRVNGLLPPLDFSNAFFNAVYALSVLTHLSEENHFNWMRELHRVTKPGGVLLLTTHGDAFAMKLTEKEKDRYYQGKLVERSNVKEGHRSFTAFHPPQFMKALFGSRWEILNWTPGRGGKKMPEQDTWLLRKNL